MDICFNNLMGNQLPRLEVIAHGPGDALLRYVMDTVKITDMKNILNSRNGEIGISQRKKIKNNISVPEASIQAGTHCHTRTCCYEHFPQGKCVSILITLVI